MACSVEYAKRQIALAKALDRIAIPLLPKLGVREAYKQALRTVASVRYNPAQGNVPKEKL